MNKKKKKIIIQIDDTGNDKSVSPVGHKALAYILKKLLKNNHRNNNLITVKI